MGSVISEKKCEKCGYEGAIEDYYYKSDELYLFCSRCGYNYSRTAVLDKKKSKEKYNQAKKFLKMNNLDKAIDILGLGGTVRYGGTEKVKIQDFSDKDKIDNIKGTLKRIKDCKFQYFFKLDKEGRTVFKEDEVKAVGSWSILFKGGGTVGCFNKTFTSKKLEEDFKKEGFVNKSGEKADEVIYTFKKDNKWFVKDVINNKEYLFKDYKKM